jgi:hypothetical protein
MAVMGNGHVTWLELVNVDALASYHIIPSTQ